MSGEATSAQIGGFLVALRAQGRDRRRDRRLRRGDARARRCRCGRRAPTSSTRRAPAATARKTFNISTAAALVAAAAGAGVAKHGNRAVSSASGSADVLEALGFALELSAGADRPLDRRARLRLHVRADAPSGDAARRAGAARARHAHGLQRARPADEPGRGARAGRRRLRAGRSCARSRRCSLRLGARGAFVVHGAVGIDELSPAGPNLVCEVVEGNVHRARDRPGRARRPALRLRGSSAAASPSENARGSARSSRAETAARAGAILLNAAGRDRRGRACDGPARGPRLRARSRRLGRGGGDGSSG